MTIKTTLSKGKTIEGSARISNGRENFKKYFDNRVLRDCIGSLNYDEFNDSTYYYETGNFEDLKNKVGGDPARLDCLFFLLRNAQHFVNNLWLIKDNSIYVTDGFLQIYPEKTPEKGFVTTGSLSLITTTALCETQNTDFATEELDNAITLYNLDPILEFTEIEENWEMPLKNPLTKNLGRIGRATYFTLGARGAASLPLKILNYCTTLECLFTSDSTEVTHKVAERFAYFLGNNFEERKKYFQLTKDAYKIRSKAVHGQSIRATNEEMQRVSQEIDSAIRNIFIIYYTNKVKGNIFKQTDNSKYDDWFNNLILG